VSAPPFPPPRQRRTLRYMQLCATTEFRCLAPHPARPASGVHRAFLEMQSGIWEPTGRVFHSIPPERAFMLPLSERTHIAYCPRCHVRRNTGWLAHDPSVKTAADG
jgi:hypothetical protein